MRGTPSSTNPPSPTPAAGHLRRATTLDRLVHNAHRLELDGQSMRKTGTADERSGIDGDANDRHHETTLSSEASACPDTPE